MKMLFPAFFALNVCMCTSAMAQSKIVGRISNPSSEAVPFAHILLFQEEDSVFLKGAIATETGDFEMDHHASQALFIRVQALGYQDYISGPITPAPWTNLGSIEIQTHSETLQEVVVTAQKPLFEQKIDRTIVNVQSSVTNMGSNVLNVLSKSPAVRVNRNTNEINLMGKQGVMVMIDNKPLRMEAGELMSLLESISSDNIATIELITAPPASYDAQGNAGIININTVKGREGLAGQFSTNLAYGERPKFGTSLNLSQQMNRVYLYANLSGSLAYDMERVSLLTDLSYPDERLLSDMQVVRKPRTGLYSGEVGLDYKLSKRSTVGLIFSALHSDWKMNATATTELESSIQGTSDQITRSYEKNILFRTLSNLNFRHAFSEHTSLSLDFDYIQFERDNPTDYEVEESVNETEENTHHFKSGAKTPLSIRVVKTDFQKRLLNNLTLEAGLKGTFSHFTNDVRVAFEENAQWMDDPGFTDLFEMDESIYAAYTSASWQLTPSLHLMSGLRYEFYQLDLSSQKQANIIHRERGNFFPSFHSNYRLDEQKEFNFSYVNRIQRPGFLILAPYFYFFDQNTLFTGNPNIIPTRSNQFQLDFRYEEVTTSIQFTSERFPVFDMQPEIDEDLHLFIVRPQQASKSQVISFTLATPWEVTDWWTSRYHFLGSHLRQSPVINGEVFTRNSYNFELSTTQNWTLGRGIDLEVAGAYYSPFYSGVIKTARRASVDLGIRKKFTSGTTFSLNVNDVFNSGSQWPIVADMRQSGLYYDWLFDAEGPVFRFNLSIPLGNQQRNERQRHSSGSEEEQQRLN